MAQKKVKLNRGNSYEIPEHNMKITNAKRRVILEVGSDWRSAKSISSSVNPYKVGGLHFIKMQPIP